MLEIVNMGNSSYARGIAKFNRELLNVLYRQGQNKELLEIYSNYLSSQNQYATATGLTMMLNGEVSHDQVSR